MLTAWRPKVGIQSPVVMPSSTSRFKRAMRRFLLAIIAVELVVVGVALLLWAYPPSAMVALALAGRSPYCATADVWQGADRRVLLNAEIERLTAGSTLIDEDPAGYELWSTPMGDYWVPRGSGASLPVLLAQQSVDNYGDVEVGVREGDVVLDGGSSAMWSMEKSVTISTSPRPRIYDSMS